MTTYTPDANKVVHTASVDFMDRYAIKKPVHIVQYDKTLPIIAVSLFKNQATYAVPSSANVNVRYKRPDGQFAYNPVLGSNSARTIVYVEMTLPMTSVYGDAEFIIEVVVGTDVVGSSTLKAVIDKNPVQEDAIEATNEFKTIYELTASAAADAASASDDADSAAEDAASAAQSATEAAASAASVDIHTYGYYPDMEVGRADSSDQLLGSPILSADESFLFKQTPDIKSNRQRIKKIKGGTIAWNQLVQNGDFADGTSKWSAITGSITASNGVLTLNPSSNTADNVSAYQNMPNWVAGHKYFVSAQLKSSVNTTRTRIRLYASEGSFDDVVIRSLSAGVKTLVSGVVNKETAGGSTQRLYIRFDAVAHATTDSLEISNVFCIDLTLLFGSTIADRIYAMEQASAGSGVAWFKKLFPATYYLYNPGQLISVNLDNKVNRGFNQWDEEYDFVDGKIGSVNYTPILPNTTYYIGSSVNATFRVDFYDYNKTNIGYQSITNSTFTTPNDAFYLKFRALTTFYGTTYNNDICINLSDPALNGTYVPYEGRSYAFDPALELRGIPSIDANDELVFDNGDEYLPGGSVPRRYGIVDLGTLNYTYYSQYNCFYTNINSIGGKPMAAYGSQTGVCSKYATNTSKVFANIPDKSIDVGSGFGASTVCSLLIFDSSYTDAATFKTAMSGVMLVYELATPTTEQSQPFASTEVVFPNGTEEMVGLGTPLLPVPIEYEYLEDLKGKLKTLPDIEQLTNSAITMGEIDNLSTAVKENRDSFIIFDVSKLVSSMTFCTIYINKGYYRIADVETGKVLSGFCSLSDTLVSVIQSGHQVTGKHYTVKWDKTLAQCERLNDAAGITIDTTNFTYNGSVNANYNNPFDSIYPWSGRKLCNVDIPTYRTLQKGDDITECVVAWEGDVNFSYSHQYGVWVYTPGFFGKSWDDGTYRYFDVTDENLPNYIAYKPSIVGRYLGDAVTLTIDGTSKSCLLPITGIPETNIAVSTLHTYAQNYGGSLNDIYTLDAVSLLYVVEFANLNIQLKLGNGVSGLYRQSSDLFLAASSGTVVKVAKSAAEGYAIPGAIMDIGTSNGGRQTGMRTVISAAVDGSDSSILNVTLDSAITVTTSTYWSIHGLKNVADSDIGSKSGYLGTNGKCNAYYRGQTFYGNMFQYVLGAYRQTGTGKVWIADENDTDNYNALDTTKHHDTGIALTSESGYIKTLGMYDGLSFPPFCTSIGGTSSNPVGDYYYVPALSTGNTILLFGGDAGDGAYDGFCGDWRYAASVSYWYYAAGPRLKTP